MPSNKPAPHRARRSAEGQAPTGRLRPARGDDIVFIVALERRGDYRPFINSWPPARHRHAMADRDFRYLIFEEAGAAAGFAILAGLTSANRSIQLLRTAVERPGEGRGRRLCGLLLAEVFDGLEAHRLHLDLFEGNDRAEALYRSLGFRDEGLLRDAERRGATWRSLKIMALLESEYRRS